MEFYPNLYLYTYIYIYISFFLFVMGILELRSFAPKGNRTVLNLKRPQKPATLPHHPNKVQYQAKRYYLFSRHFPFLVAVDTNNNLSFQ